VLYSFNQTDGSHPYGDLLLSNGALYGTTNNGGANFGGTLFKMDLAGNLLWSYSPPVTVGYQPFAGVIKVGNWLYGTMALNAGSPNGGSVYRIKTDGTAYQTLHAFTGGGTDGIQPFAGLVAFNGSLFGTTPLGGTYGYGTVYRIDANGGNYSVVYSFSAINEGAYPKAKLLPVGNPMGATELYGNTEGGGGASGTLFKITAAGVLTTVYQFTGGVDGKYPGAELMQATDGKLYSTTGYDGSYLFGTIYSFVP
jgi:uncharacterized repeat protein (TIGR03803 family)